MESNNSNEMEDTQLSDGLSPALSDSALFFDIDSDIRDKTSELSIYQSLPCINEPENVLNFWRTNAENLPILSKVAKRILSMAHSTSHIESAFSEENFLINDKRTNLNGKSVLFNMIIKSLYRFLNE